MKKTDSKISVHELIISIVIAVFSVILCIFSANTLDGKLDGVMSSINDVNLHHYYNGFVSSYVHIEKDESMIKKEGLMYDKLMSHFYYYSKSNGCREMIEDKTSTKIGDDCFDFKMLSQNVFSVSQNNVTTMDNRHLNRLEMNMFYVYFGDDILGNRGYLKTRFNCDSFCFISDTLADKLIAKYDLLSFNDPYKELILNEKYAVIDLDIGETKNAKRICINNIISSKHRFAPRITSLYGDFALFYCNTNMNNSFSKSSFEIDLKVNQFGNKRIMYDVNTLGYNTSNSTTEFYIYDYASKTHVHNLDLDNLYVEAYKANNNLFTILYYTFLLLGCIFVTFLSIADKDRNKVQILINIAMPLTFLLVLQFINTYFMFSVFSIFCLAVLLIIYRKEVFKRYYDKYKGLLFFPKEIDNRFFEIEI